MFQIIFFWTDFMKFYIHFCFFSKQTHSHTCICPNMTVCLYSRCLFDSISIHWKWNSLMKLRSILRRSIIKCECNNNSKLFHEFCSRTSLRSFIVFNIARHVLLAFVSIIVYIITIVFLLILLHFHLSGRFRQSPATAYNSHCDANGQWILEYFMSFATPTTVQNGVSYYSRFYLLTVH